MSQCLRALTGLAQHPYLEPLITLLGGINTSGLYGYPHSRAQTHIKIHYTHNSKNNKAEGGGKIAGHGSTCL